MPINNRVSTFHNTRFYQIYMKHVTDEFKPHQPNPYVQKPKPEANYSDSSVNHDKPFYVVKPNHSMTYMHPIIVEGLYYDNSTDNHFGKPFVDLEPHDFVITHDTYHISQRRLMRVCSVIRHDGNDDYLTKHLVITRMYKAETSLLIHLAHHLDPVVNFHNYGMMNSHLSRLVYRYAKMDSVLHNYHSDRIVDTNDKPEVQYTD